MTSATTDPKGFPKPLGSGLQVIPIRYASNGYAGDEHRALAAYALSGVYEQAGVPFEVIEPRMPAGAKDAEPHLQLGALGGAIADIVADARRAGRAVLVTGGNCSHAPGVLGGLQDACGPGARIGLVWFDAHGDFNTPRTTLTHHLGGMPVAVCAGLAWPEWRERAHVRAPLPTDRMVLVDLRNLDPDEERLIRATDAVIVAPLFFPPGLAGGTEGGPSTHTSLEAGGKVYPAPEVKRTRVDLERAVADLAERVDLIYLHVDADILDQAFVPSHRTREPNGPDIDQVLDAIDCVMATGKVVAYAVVSVYYQGPQHEVDLASGVELVRGGLRSWRRYGSPAHRNASAYENTSGYANT